MPQPLPSPNPAQETTRKLLAGLWERSLPTVRERVMLLERASNAVGLGILSPQLRGEAMDVAHKLSGSLGMFGYPEATLCARQIEQQLEIPGPVDALEFAKALDAMRAALAL